MNLGAASNPLGTVRRIDGLLELVCGPLGVLVVIGVVALVWLRGRRVAAQ